MSIIYDALKKVEANFRIQKIPPQAPPEHNSAGPQKIPQPTANKVIKILIYILVVGIGFGLSFVITNAPRLLKARDPASLAGAPRPVSQVLTSPSVVPADTTEQPKPARAKKPTGMAALVLNGICISEDETYCLINNQILEVGDKIAGNIITRISEDEVELNAEGNSFVLSTNLR